MDIKELKEVCRQVRIDIINEVTEAASGHPGGSLSAVEMLVALYFEVMNIVGRPISRTVSMSFWEMTSVSSITMSRQETRIWDICFTAFTVCSESKLVIAHSTEKPFC